MQPDDSTPGDQLSRRRFTAIAGAAATASALSSSAPAVQNPTHQNPATTTTTAFRSDWQGSRVWAGPEYWANPLQDWRVEEGQLLGRAGQDRTVHLLTRQTAAGEGDLQLEVTVQLVDAPAPRAKRAGTWGGWMLGIRGTLPGYRNALVHGTPSLRAGLRGDGRLLLGDRVSDASVDAGQPVRLVLRIASSARTAQATMSAVDPSTSAASASVTASLSADQLAGNVALAAIAEGAAQSFHWGFRDFTADGSLLTAHDDQRFGPVLWTQYTLSDRRLKLTALFPPLGEADAWQATLQVQSDGRWQTAAEAPIDRLSRTATFAVDGWDDARDVPYRVVYDWQGHDAEWTGTVRRDPHDAPRLKIGVFSCDHGEVFPNERIVRNVLIQDPDLVFFAGDQIYEGHGGFGVARQAPTAEAMLDYLRKYWQFGWSWRDVLKDRPSIIIPDDHDVFQGNLWGHGGRALPESPDGKGFEQGGFLMPVEWVNAIQRTQVAHLPDPADPAPCDSGIEVYFTAMRYGGASLAIIEDRKFKSGPGAVLTRQQRAAAQQDPAAIDVADAHLLGERQERFLRRWANDQANADFRIVCSQTIFCKATTHAGSKLTPSLLDLDCNGWPQSGRRRALQAVSAARPIMLHGDQHLGALLIHGIDQWEDAALAFMVPGTSNGFPRAWWPEQPAEVGGPGTRDRWTGRYRDALGNRMTILAVANPEPGSNLLRRRSDLTPETIAHEKGSGHGIVILDRQQATATFEMWRLQFDANAPRPEDQFAGFPKTWPLAEA